MRQKGDETVFSLRLPTRDAERLQRAARSCGVTVSRMAREALARGLQPPNAAPLSYGIPDQQPGVTLSISILGISTSETRTGGGLKVEWQ
jgi:predicted transcriptional regulator